MSNPTTPFSWQMPTNTDLVTDLPADFEVFGQAVATSMADLLGGTTGQILSKATGTDMDFTWVSAAPGDITDVIAGTGITVTSPTGPSPTVSINTAVTADLTTAQTLTTKTLTAPVLNNPLMKSPEERLTISATAATGTVAFDTQTQGILYYTSNASANFTLNFTNVNANLTTGDSISCVFLNTNGATAYYASAFQVDSVSVTPKWSGGTAPTAGNASAIDSYSFIIIKTGAATFTVLAGGAVKFA
jgi:hypothetical protein